MNKLDIYEVEDCGCNGPKLMLQEGQDSIILSEGIKYHIREGRMLIHNIYRPLSKNYFSLVREARDLYNKGLLSVTEDDAELLESNLGEFGEYNGIKVPLDYIFEVDELKNMINEVWNFKTDGVKAWDYGKILPQDMETFLGKIVNTPGVTDDELVGIKNRAKELYKDNRITRDQLNFFLDHNLEDFKEMFSESLNEAAKAKKKTPPIGKPKRGGSKKFYVFVRKPGGKIKKVSFGMAGGGLRAKLNNPKARRAFADRHKCSQAKDRTTARYWSCRLPRYAKLLGFKTSFSGYW